MSSRASPAAAGARNLLYVAAALRSRAAEGASTQ